MLVRDAPDAESLEVLMVQRNLNSDFVGGAYVFPGGAVDPADGGPDAEALCSGRTDAEASALLGLPSGGLAYWAAVVRECFEEAGVLLCYRGDLGKQEMVSFLDPADEARFAASRSRLNAGDLGFLQLCRDEGIVLAADHVHYFAHWITPEGAPRRYDTRFFVAAAPQGQTPINDAGETIDEVWVTPQEALRRHRDGEIEIIFPTIRNLQAIGRFHRSEDLLSAAADAADRVPVIEPRVIADGRGVRIVLPGDPGYARADEIRPRADPAVFNEAVRAVSLEANQESPPEG
jgi:8-oxo-dGTP pyrophosphatase MutT (NUDIX family)